MLLAGQFGGQSGHSSFFADRQSRPATPACIASLQHGGSSIRMKFATGARSVVNGLTTGLNMG